ncbi:MAG: hypothetical protein J0H68_03100 [Sphingobacteriia bacterium]|nr:hypothetical protein [Sphingobacteriia bacterium]
MQDKKRSYFELFVNDYMLNNMIEPHLKLHHYYLGNTKVTPKEFFDKTESIDMSFDIQIKDSNGQPQAITNPSFEEYKQYIPEFLNTFKIKNQKDLDNFKDFGKKINELKKKGLKYDEIKKHLVEEEFKAIHNDYQKIAAKGDAASAQEIKDLANRFCKFMKVCSGRYKNELYQTDQSLSLEDRFADIDLGMVPKEKILLDKINKIEGQFKEDSAKLNQRIQINEKSGTSFGDFFVKMFRAIFGLKTLTSKESKRIKLQNEAMELTKSVQAKFEKAFDEITKREEELQTHPYSIFFDAAKNLDEMSMEVGEGVFKLLESEVGKQANELSKKNAKKEANYYQNKIKSHTSPVEYDKDVSTMQDFFFGQKKTVKTTEFSNDQFGKQIKDFGEGKEALERKKQELMTKYKVGQKKGMARGDD